MPLSIGTDRLLFGEQQLRARRFTELVNAHLAHVPDTRNLEAEGASLVKRDFESLALSHFIRAVFKWGGHSDCAARTLYVGNKGNPDLQPRFRAAAAWLAGPLPDLGGALQELNRVTGLGPPSMASKHLRFLCPEFSPVLDSMVVEHVGYEYSVDGYRQWSADSVAAARFLEGRSIPNPMDRGDGGWYAGDVDMAIFAFLNGW